MLELHWQSFRKKKIQPLQLVYNLVVSFISTDYGSNREFSGQSHEKQFVFL